jgi:F-type H+-transporting ATPase subunit epsilon
MTCMTLCLESATGEERVEDVESFVAEDLSGSFGILPGHERLVTVAEFGLAKFRTADGGWQYLAAPGAVIYKQNDELHFCTRRYVRGTDFETIRDALREDLAAEERSLRAVKQSLRGLEEQMLKKLWELGRREGERL